MGVETVVDEVEYKNVFNGRMLSLTLYCRKILGTEWNLHRYP